MSLAALTHRGRVRPTNEDRWFADANAGLYLVADGMGGHHGGSVASRAITELLVPLVLKATRDDSAALDESIARRLADTVAEFSRELHKESSGRAGLHGMGAALVFALLRGTTCLVGHMGDCRAYLMRDGALSQLTADHTLARYLQEAGVTESKIRQVGKERLTRFVGMPETVPPEVELVDVCDGDRILLCSDGLSNCVQEAELERILCDELDLNRACERLVNATLAHGAPDNVTLLLVAIGSPDCSPRAVESDT